MTNKYYVYHLINPISNNVFYVGKGCGKRIYTHEQKVIRSPSKYCKSDKDIEILSVLNSGLRVVHRMKHENLREDEAIMMEEIEISEIGIENLTNKREKGYVSSPTNRHESAGKFLARYWLSIKDANDTNANIGKHGVSIASIHRELDEVLMSALSCDKINSSAFVRGISSAIESSKHQLFSYI